MPGPLDEEAEEDGENFIFFRASGREVRAGGGGSVGYGRGGGGEGCRAFLLTSTEKSSAATRSTDLETSYVLETAPFIALRRNLDLLLEPPERLPRRDSVTSVVLEPRDICLWDLWLREATLGGGTEEGTAMSKANRKKG